MKINTNKIEAAPILDFNLVTLEVVGLLDCFHDIFNLVKQIR